MNTQNKEGRNTTWSVPIKNRRRNRSISELIKSQDWTTVSDVLVGTFVEKAYYRGDAPTVDIPNLLHRLCMYGAPHHVIEVLLDICPDLCIEADHYGQLPLHFAAACGTSEQVIDTLVNLYPKAAGIVDVEGRTPLMLACSHRDADLNIVRILVSASPTTVNDENNHGANALEYAIKAKAPIEVMRFLMRSSKREWLRRRREGTRGEKIGLKKIRNSLEIGGTWKKGPTSETEQLA